MKRVLVEAAIAVPMVLALLGVLIGVTLLWILVTGTESIPESTWGNVRLRSVTAMVVLAVAAVALAPVFEEIFFRGFLHNALRRWCPATVRTGRSSPELTLWRHDSVRSRHPR